jgi:histone deacetylase 1/2
MEKPAPGVSGVGSRRAFKKKLNALWQVERYKAWLVAQGYTQRTGVDFDEVWARVEKRVTLRALLALAAAEDLEIHQMDVKTACLHGELEESVWMWPPPGYVVGPPGCLPLCRLQKAIYGLKQASRAWHAVLCRILGGADLEPA